MIYSCYSVGIKEGGKSYGEGDLLHVDIVVTLLGKIKNHAAIAHKRSATAKHIDFYLFFLTLFYFNTFDNSITKRVVYYERYIEMITNATRTIVKETNCKKKYTK